MGGGIARIVQQEVRSHFLVRVQNLADQIRSCLPSVSKARTGDQPFDLEAARCCAGAEVNLLAQSPKAMVLITALLLRGPFRLHHPLNRPLSLFLREADDSSIAKPDDCDVGIAAHQEAHQLAEMREMPDEHAGFLVSPKRLANRFDLAAFQSR
jgi:hypothetical protein